MSAMVQLQHHGSIKKITYVLTYFSAFDHEFYVELVKL